MALRNQNDQYLHACCKMNSRIYVCLCNLSLILIHFLNTKYFLKYRVYPLFMLVECHVKWKSFLWAVVKKDNLWQCQIRVSFDLFAVYVHDKWCLNQDCYYVNMIDSFFTELMWNYLTFFSSCRQACEWSKGLPVFLWLVGPFCCYWYV